MKKIIFLITIFVLTDSIYAQNTNKNENRICIAGIIDTAYYDMVAYKYRCKINNIKVIRGTYDYDTISISMVSEWGRKITGNINQFAILTPEKVNNHYIIGYERLNYFTPIAGVLNNEALKYYNVDNPEILINETIKYFKETDIENAEEKAKNILKVIYDKDRFMFLREFAVMDLKNLRLESCLPRPYINKIYEKLYNDTILDFNIRQISGIGGGSEESIFSLYNNDIAQKEYSLIYRDKGKNHLKYAIPLWKKGVIFCDSMIDKYQSIIKNYPVVHDTISLQDKKSLFFTGKIKKASKNKLIIKNLKIFEGKYLEDEITVRTNIDTVFKKNIVGSKVLINTTIVKGKIVLNVSHKHKGFYKPPLIPDGNNLFILNTDNLLKNNINIKPNELIEKITQYYSGLNAEIKIKEKKLTNYIKKGEYLFIRTRSLWEFSDLSLQYDSLCWDYNKKHEFLNSIINSYRKYKHPPLPIIVTADMLFNKSFNENYSSKYKTNIYEMDRSSNLQSIHNYQKFLKSKDAFAKKYATMRFQDIITYYKKMKEILQERIKKYDN